MIEWSIDAFRACESVRSIVVAAPARATSHDLGGARPRRSSPAAPPGPQSVANALEAVGTELVAIHDAARPLLTPELVEDAGRRPRRGPRGRRRDRRRPRSPTRSSGAAGGRAASTTHEGRMHARRRGDAGSRALWAAQTPQVFRTEALREALAVDAERRDAATDEAMLVEAAGGTVLIHPTPAREPEGDDAARPAGRRAAARADALSREQDPDQRRGEAELADAEAMPRLTAPSRAGDRGAAGEGEQQEEQLSWRRIRRDSLGASGSCDADRLPPAPAPRRGRHHRRALLHRRERRPLPGRRRGGRDRGAGRLRARLPLPPGARPLAPPALGGATRATTSTPTASSSAARRCGSGSSATSSPAPRTGPPRCSRRATSTTSSARSTSSARRRAVDHDGWDVWEGERRPRRGLAPLLRGARRVRPLRPLRHPRPPRPGQGLGRRPAAARARPARLLRARGRGDRRERDRGRGLDRGPAQAGRRALPVARLRRDVRRGRAPPSRSPPTPTCPSRSASATTARSSSSTSSGSSEICVFERRRAPAGAARASRGRLSHGRDRLRQPPLRRRAAGWSSAGSRSSTSAASTATPTPTSSPTR